MGVVCGPPCCVCCVSVVRAGFWCVRLLWEDESFECAALRVKLYSLAIRGLPCDVLLCFVLQRVFRTVRNCRRQFGVARVIVMSSMS